MALLEAVALYWLEVVRACLVSLMTKRREIVPFGKSEMRSRMANIFLRDAFTQRVFRGNDSSGFPLLRSLKTANRYRA